MPVFNGFFYTPLSGKDAIRLILLEPSTKKTAPLTCQILEHRLSAPDLDYSAVSYVWGKQKLSQTLQIDCDGDVSYLRITPNVEDVMKGLRLPDRRRFLWIDAICFDQSNELEKAQQIPVMGDIYKKARVVDIWLGSEQCTTPGLIKFFRKLGRLPDVTNWRTQSDMADRIVLLMRQSFTGDGCGALEAVMEFFDHKWFSRRWIIQEACLARCAVVHCGKGTLDLQLLIKAATNFQRLDMSHFPVKMAANLGNYQKRERSMLELLWDFHASECREAKDRIAAFLGLARDEHKFCLDYTKPWHDIAKELACFTCMHGDNDTRLQLILHMFEFGRMSREGDPLWPSWIPDWSSTRCRRLPYIPAPRNVDTFESYPRSPGHSAKATLTYDHGCLGFPPSVPGLDAQRLRISYTITLRRSFRHTEDCETRKVSDVWETLFARMGDKKLHIEALLNLLETVSLFRHTDVDRETTSEHLAQFEDNTESHYRISNHRRLLLWLRTLGSVLRDFCFVELETCSQSFVDKRGYGVGPELMLVDDIAIPLWSFQQDNQSLVFQGQIGGSVQIDTMLVVRRLASECKDVFDEAKLVQRCEVVGPLVCVTWTQASSDGNGQSDSRRTCRANCQHFLPIRIA